MFNRVLGDVQAYRTFSDQIRATVTDRRYRFVITANGKIGSASAIEIRRLS